MKKLSTFTSLRKNSDVLNCCYGFCLRLRTSSEYCSINFVQTSPFIQSMTLIHEYQFCPTPTVEHDTQLIKDLSVGYYFDQIVVSIVKSPS